MIRRGIARFGQPSAGWKTRNLMLPEVLLRRKGEGWRLYLSEQGSQIVDAIIDQPAVVVFLRPALAAAAVFRGSAPGIAEIVERRGQARVFRNIHLANGFIGGNGSWMIAAM